MDVFEQQFIADDTVVGCRFEGGPGIDQMGGGGYCRQRPAMTASIASGARKRSASSSLARIKAFFALAKSPLFHASLARVNWTLADTLSPAGGAGGRGVCGSVAGRGSCGGKTHEWGLILLIGDDIADKNGYPCPMEERQGFFDVRFKLLDAAVEKAGSRGVFADRRPSTPYASCHSWARRTKRAGRDCHRPW